MHVLVAGGAGFIGRHVALALLARGHTVAIGSRHPTRSARNLPPAAQHCEMRLAHHEQLLHPDAWRELLADADAVVNCVGILRQRWHLTRPRESYDRVHHLAPAALAAACRARPGVRFIHVSALGLHAQARSGFITSKLRGEQAIAHAGGDYCIVRPSLLDGEGGYGALWLRRLAQWPVHPVPASATGRIAPLAVTDLGEAIARLVEARDHADMRIVELGGTRSMTMRELIGALRGANDRRPAPHVVIPHLLTRIASHLLDLLHLTPFSFGHLELMQRDNVPRLNALPELLGRDPHPLGVSPRVAQHDQRARECV